MQLNYKNFSDICDNNSISGASWCHPAVSRCYGALETIGYPNEMWARDSSDESIAYTFRFISGFLDGPGGRSHGYAFSARCVLALMQYYAASSAYIY